MVQYVCEAHHPQLPSTTSIKAVVHKHLHWMCHTQLPCAVCLQRNKEAERRKRRRRRQKREEKMRSGRRLEWRGGSKAGTRSVRHGHRLKKCRYV